MIARRARAVLVVLVVVLGAAGCSSDDGGSAKDRTTTTAAVSTETVGRIDVGKIADPATCDPIAAGLCSEPYPNDLWTVADPSTPTGRRLHLRKASMPKNAQGVAIDPTAWNQLDGFSPAAAPIVQVPGVDLARSGAAPVTDIAASLDRDEPIVLLDATTGKRLAHWSELDAAAKGDDVPTLFVRPAQLLPEGHRIVVAMRGLKDAAGAPVAPTRAFRAYRDRLATGNPQLERRRKAMERTFADLAKAGVDRKGLVLAWDFTVASEQAIAGPLLKMRDDAFEALGDAAPTFRVTSTEPSTDDGIAREVTGTYEVPQYLSGDGSAGQSLVWGKDGQPARNGTYNATFRCIVPAAATPEHPASSGLYGHGLLGTSEQVGAAREVAVEQNTVFCGTDLIGMAEDDLPNAAKIVSELSTFHTLSDRLLQGHLNTLFLGRLMIRPDGLGSDPAFQQGGQSVIGKGLEYYGISQGGIMGAATTAVAQDWTRAVLGVPAANYGLLLDRSVDFDEFRAVYEPSYPDPAVRAFGLQLIQGLWDRGEASGYLQHLTRDPYEGTPKHSVLLHAAFGDHQVANIATANEARTIGASVVRPVVAAGRSPERDPFWAVPAIERFPFTGSAVVMWDSGSPTPPIANLPPRDGEDPHGDPRAEPAAIEQIVRFFETGRVIDACHGSPCTAQPQD